MHFSAKFYSKIWIYIWIYFKGGTKSEDKNFIGIKSWRKLLEGLKRKVGIFVETIIIFNPNK